jgi:hypothetical protein
MAKHKKPIRKSSAARLSSWSAQFKDYGLGVVLGLGGLTLCFASIDGKITDDRALYQNLTEIRAQKQKDLNFDGDFAALRAAEARFQEKNLPHPRPRVRAQQIQTRSRAAVVRKPLSARAATTHGLKRVQSPRSSSVKKWTGNARARS